MCNSGKSVVANKRSGELHVRSVAVGSCQVDEIERSGNAEQFDSVEAAMQAGYSRFCGHCERQIQGNTVREGE